MHWQDVNNRLRQDVNKKTYARLKQTDIDKDVNKQI